MGKKRVVKETQEQILKETERIAKKLKREIKIKGQKEFQTARLYITSTYNNTIITLTDEKGNTLAWRSAGSVGFKGTKKGTAYAASQVAQVIAKILERLKIAQIDIFVKGIGGGRDTALKTLANYNIDIRSIKDITPLAHNGPRPPKPKRL